MEKGYLKKNNDNEWIISLQKDEIYEPKKINPIHSLWVKIFGFENQEFKFLEEGEFVTLKDCGHEPKKYYQD